MKKRRRSYKKENSKRKRTQTGNLVIDDERKEIESIIKETQDKEYEVEKILKRKTIKGKAYYLVKWKGWDSRFNEWVEEKSK